MKNTSKNTRKRPQTPRVPPRPDPRRGPNQNAQRGEAHCGRRAPRRGQAADQIALRRLRALELRRAGCSYRQIASQLGVDLHTAHSDVMAEVLELRNETKHEAQDLRDIELARCDELTFALWPTAQAGDAKAVSAVMRISERRARLLGLDAPTAQNVRVEGDMTVLSRDELGRILDRLEDEELEEFSRVDKRRTELFETAKARLRELRQEGWFK